MTADILELEARFLQLGPADRARLLERLIDSFEPDNRVRDAWIEEARRRHEEITSGRVAAVPVSDALARIRARIG